AGLFLRLILERDLSVSEILVVTFTEAATEELRERIRRMLVEAGQVLDGGSAENAAVAETVEQALFQYSVAGTVRSQAGSASRNDKTLPASVLRGRVDRALRAFDEAHICTIHSFCQRTLRDHAFEGSALFDTELVTDDSGLLQTVADDYWRRRFYGADALLVSTALYGRLSPEALVPWLRLHSRHPTLRVISNVDDRSLEGLAGELQAVFTAARAQWRAHRDAIRAWFLPSAPWAKGDHGKPAEVAGWLEQVGHCFADDGPTPEGLAILEEFTSENLEENTRAHQLAPKHEFFKQCAELVTAQTNYLRGLRLDFLSTAPAALRQRKQELKIQTYDDLLTGLRRALRGPSGPALAGEVRRKFRAALIDEFQDTDPVQWEVFRRLFGPLEESAAGKRANGKEFSTFALSDLESSPDESPGSGFPSMPRPSLFLIGDPKQAIYGFRGADIFTYIDAGQSAPDAYTLDRNWRSESGLVGAINSLFSAAPNPFAFEQIPFLKVSSAGTADEAPLRENGEQSPPLRLWFLPREPGQKEITKEFAEDKLPGVVAGEIVRLLNGNATLGARRLTPRDIAVLVMENRQATLMQEVLRRVGVPSVLHTEESVFASREARELERVLAALSQPGNEWALRAALATDLMGLSGTELDAMAGDEAAWQSWLEHARAHHDRWLEQGFMPMFRHWLHEGQVRQRLLAFEDGERR